MPNQPYIEHDDGTLEIPVVGHPFYGPEYLGNRDVHGQYFHPGTDFGKITRVETWWDHAKGMQDPELSKYPQFADEPIGVAEKRGTSEEGEIWSILVDKSYRYKNLIKRLAEERMVLASSHPFQRSVKISPDGRIDRWHTMEMTLTVNAANPDADLYFKSIVVEELEKMAEKGDEVVKTPETEQAPVEPAVVQAEAAVAAETPAPEAAAPVEAEAEKTVDKVAEKTVTSVSSTPATDAAKALLEKVAEVPAPAEPVKEKDSGFMAADIMAQMARLCSDIEFLKSMFVNYIAMDMAEDMAEGEMGDMMQKSITMRSLRKELAEVKAAQTDIQTAFPLMVEAIAKSVNAKIATDAVKSPAEVQAEKSVMEKLAAGKQPTAPTLVRNPAAPGRDRKANMGKVS